MSIETMTKLASVTVGAGGSATIEFTNIPQTYTDLVVKYSTRGTNADVYTSGVLTFNNSTTGYISKWAQGNGSTAIGGNYSGSSIAGWNATGSTATANTFGNGEFYISNYTSSNYKTITHEDAIETNATTTYMELNTGIWQNISAITTVTLGLASSATFVQYSTATLYGVKSARQTAGNSIKATGGNISFDGTYVYHVFNSSGTFTPTKPITADVLVVAGGGGGGNDYPGGGGGGGLRGLNSQYLTASTPYTITVGAGGATSSSGSVKGSNGSDSSIGGGNLTTLTASGGGGGASRYNNKGSDGGSAGGGAYGGLGGSGNAGGYSPVEGYNGGNATSGSGSGSGGGGGGAGGAGGNGANLGAGGNGGVGSSAYSSWAIGSKTGEIVSGIGYYAGGGKGYGDTDSSTARGGYGGGSGYGKAGLVNTGGGAGGDTPANGGGSGIVIVRYKA